MTSSNLRFGLNQYNIHTMFKLSKNFLMLCLVMLQFFAPFIHAHAYGLDDSKEHGIHIHSSEVSAPVNDPAVDNTQISDQPIVGAIVTVASGIKVSKADDIADNLAMLAVLFTIISIIFNESSPLRPSFFQAPKYRHTPYSLQSPRAPPY
jgi:hypothetical protein